MVKTGFTVYIKSLQALFNEKFSFDDYVDCNEVKKLGLFDGQSKEIALRPSCQIILSMTQNKRWPIF